MFEQRSTQKELMDDAMLADEALSENLAELEIYNNWLGAKRTLLDALDRIYQRYKSYLISRKILIADIGCGGGDLLEAVDKWTNKKQIKTKLLGIDINPFMLAYAKRRIGEKGNYEFLLSDVVKELPLIESDIVCLNSVCHHFNDIEFVNLLKNLRQQTRLAIIINDLQRHWFSYFSFKWLTRLLKFSYLSQYDGPLSVLRAFQKHELVQALTSAGIQNYAIRKSWLLRWQLIIWLE